MNKKTEKKIQIANAGTELYLKNPHYTMSALADAANLEKKDEIYDYFSNRRDVIEFFYEGLILQYQQIIKRIEGYSRYSLSEKLSNLALTVIDLMEPHKEFVKRTYKPFILCSTRNTAYSKALYTQFKMIYESDSEQSRLSSMLNTSPLYKAAMLNFHLLIRFWLSDESESAQKTMELVDKWTAFVQEIHHSSVLDKGFDVAKFLFYNSPFSITQNPFSK